MPKPQMSAKVRIPVILMVAGLLLVRHGTCDSLLGPTSEETENREKENIKAWHTQLYLLFCREVAQIYFLPPPAYPKVHLLNFEIRVIDSKTSKIINKLLQNPSSIKPVNNATGLIRIDISDVEFAACTHGDCKGYTADAYGLSFNDTFACDCRGSFTKEDCIFYPNGTIDAMRPGINCSLPHALQAIAAQQASKCMSRYTTIAPIPTGLMVSVCSISLVLLTVLVICVLWLLPPLPCRRAPLGRQALAEILARDPITVAIVKTEQMSSSSSMYTGASSFDADSYPLITRPE